MSKSLFSDVPIPDCDIWEFLFNRQDRSFPDTQKIFIDPDTNLSYDYRTVKNFVASFGSFLKSQWSWKKGDVLAFYTPNSIHVPPLLWGCHWANGVVTTANPAYTSTELLKQLKDSEAKAIVTHASQYSTAKNAALEAQIPLERIIVINGDSTKYPQHINNIIEVQDSSNVSRQSSKPEDLAFLVYSSGTTGNPKGVMLSHRNVISNILHLKHECGRLSRRLDGNAIPEARMLSVLPFYHIYGLVRLLHDPIYHGITTVVFEKFEIEKFCSTVQRYNITFAHIVPPILVLLANHPVVSKYDLNSLQMLSSGAAPLSWDLTKKVYERIKVPVKQAYGLSETSPTTHSQEWDEWDRFPGSSGKLLPNQSVKYLDENNNVVPRGSAGELCIKGPNVFLGYWKNPEATKQTMTADGFFKTGDIGYEDEHGNMYIIDRAKELIKYKGFQVAPAELEGILLTHPTVDDVAVIGVWREEMATELPKAYIVIKASVKPTNTTEKQKLATVISQWLAGKVAPYKRLSGGIEFVETIPKSPSGKILRRLLRDQANIDQTKKAGRPLKANL